nr:hypothetical protein TetV2_00230 [Oceanusvirus sp.]
MVKGTSAAVITVFSLGVLVAFFIAFGACSSALRRENESPADFASNLVSETFRPSDRVLPSNGGVCLATVTVDERPDKPDSAFTASWRDPKTGVWTTGPSASTRKQLAMNALMMMKAYETKRNACLEHNLPRFGLCARDEEAVRCALFEHYGTRK